MATKKLIEVALPLDKINAESAREKSIRNGHPATLHLWWSRKPTASARAVLFASLVDDPSSHPDIFPTEEDRQKERDRLFKIIGELVKWENFTDDEVLNKAKAEIEKYTTKGSLVFIDPFAGGGSIPFEAQRLGLEAHAYDLNPVAVMINKLMIEIPQRFMDMAPVNPKANIVNKGFNATGLANDIKYYGERIKNLLFNEVGGFYPDITLSKNERRRVIAWIWTRMIKCPNPACGAEVPLFNSLDLSKKKGHEHHIELTYNGKRVIFSVKKGVSKIKGTVNRGGAKCPCCGNPIGFEYLRTEGQKGNMTSRLAAIVVENKRGRAFLNPNPEHEQIALIEKLIDTPHAEMPYNPRNFNTPIYGMSNFEDVFTNRQMLALTTLVKLLDVIKSEVEVQAIKCGMKNDHIPIEEGGCGARAYAEAIVSYLAFAIDKAADAWSSLVGWRTTVESTRNTFSLQALPMVWSYAEVNPFSSSCGNWSDACVENIYKFVERLKKAKPGFAYQQDAQSDCGIRNAVISTDPPYYDNIVYGDLSDYFYMWMRYSLKELYPKTFSTMIAPKSEELVATPYRFNGSKEEACDFFESGMTKAFKQIYKYATDDYPITIYYAYKQQSADTGNLFSNGWETMLTAIINSGFVINGTWPMRTEKVGRTNSIGANALASSIVLVCRKRDKDAAKTTRRNFINVLHRDMRNALKQIQKSNIAPVDLAQSSIGPGIGVFSQYSKVMESDGSTMTVRDALQIINEEVDLFFNEQVGARCHEPLLY